MRENYISSHDIKKACENVISILERCFIPQNMNTGNYFNIQLSRLVSIFSPSNRSTEFRGNDSESLDVTFRVNS